MPFSLFPLPCMHIYTDNSPILLIFVLPITLIFPIIHVLTSLSVLSYSSVCFLIMLVDDKCVLFFSLLYLYHRISSTQIIILSLINVLKVIQLYLFKIIYHQWNDLYYLNQKHIRSSSVNFKWNYTEAFPYSVIIMVFMFIDFEVLFIFFMSL